MFALTGCATPQREDWVLTYTYKRPITFWFQSERACRYAQARIPPAQHPVCQRGGLQTPGT